MTLGRFHVDVKIVCAFCGSDKTYIRKSTWTTADGIKHQTLVPHWCYGPNRERICHSCRLRYIDNPSVSKETRVEGNARKIQFKDRTLRLPEAPRIGVCNVCRAVVPFDCQRTQMNHHEYDESNPRKGALESCVSCHRRYHIEKTWESKDKQCFGCYHKVGEYKYSWYFNEPTRYILCTQCNVTYIRKQ